MAKKIGSIRIAKNPNFPSGTSLQAYIKTNRGELRKVFGNPNMGESGDGKSKGKEWNLRVDGNRVTIYDKREKDKKGTKYFNIGGKNKYGALLVAQALSIHRNERVYAKETVPQWLEDKRQYQQVKSIDEHPDLTYHRAKEYEDNRGRYRAESFSAPLGGMIPDASKPQRMEQSELEYIFNSLKPKQAISVWFNSAVRSADDWTELQVGRKSKSKKYNLEKISLINPKNPKGSKYYLYNRQGRISFAMGDMGTSLIAIKTNGKNAESFSADDQTRHYKNLGIGAALVAGLAYWIKR